MGHQRDHIIIQKLRDFLVAPLPAGAKRWHAGLTLVVVEGLSRYFF